MFVRSFIVALIFGLASATQAQDACVRGLFGRIISCPTCPTTPYNNRYNGPFESHPAYVKVTGQFGGSGCCVWSDESRSVVVTAAHVIGRNGTATVCPVEGGGCYKATVNGINHHTDACVLVVDSKLPGVIPLAETDPAIGTMCKAIGLKSPMREWDAEYKNRGDWSGMTIKGDSGGPILYNNTVVGTIETTLTTGPTASEIWPYMPDWTKQKQPEDYIPDMIEIPLPEPEPAEIDYDKITDLLYERIKNDASFRGPAGPPGPSGLPGAPGAPGRDAEIDIDLIVSKVVEKIEIKQPEIDYGILADEISKRIQVPTTEPVPEPKKLPMPTYWEIIPRK